MGEKKGEAVSLSLRKCLAVVFMNNLIIFCQGFSVYYYSTFYLVSWNPRPYSDPFNLHLHPFLEENSSRAFFFQGIRT